MKIIKCIFDLIWDELDASEHYIEKALKYQIEQPESAQLFFTLSTEEMKHVHLLHDEIVKLIQYYREKDGEPPEKMLFLYDYLHEKFIKCEKKIRLMQEMYK